MVSGAWLGGLVLTTILYAVAELLHAHPRTKPDGSMAYATLGRGRPAASS